MKSEVSIALVDDIASERKLAKVKLDGVLILEKFNGIHFSIKEFKDGKELLDSKEVFDLVLMDYEMPEMNGIETARQLNKNGAKSKILFLSGYDYNKNFKPLQEASFIDLNVGFILKNDPIHQFQYEVERVISEILDVYFIRIKHYREEKDLDSGKLKKVYTETLINMKEIVTVQSRNDVVFIEMENDFGDDENEYSTDPPLKDWILKLAERDFVSVSKNCLVHLKYVRAHSSKLVTLITGEDVKLGRHYKNSFTQAYENYMIREAMK